MTKELTDKVPLDDDLFVDTAADGAADADADPDNDADTDADADADTEATTADADADADTFTEEELTAILGSERPDAIPVGRFNEVNEDRKRAQRENDELRAILASAIKPAAVEAPAPKARDFAAELAKAKADYKEGLIDVDAYMDLRDGIVEAKNDAKVEAIKQTVIADRENLAMERANQALAAEAAKTFEKFPFLNPKDDDFNEKAAKEVVEERNELIARGVDPATALRKAVRMVAPDYVTVEAKPVAGKTADDLQKARDKKALETAANASQKVPPVVGGAPNRSAGGKIAVGTSVKDADKLAKLSDAEREKIFEAG